MSISDYNPVIPNSSCFRQSRIPGLSAFQSRLLQKNLLNTAFSTNLLWSAAARMYYQRYSPVFFRHTVLQKGISVTLDISYFYTSASMWSEKHWIFIIIQESCIHQRRCSCSICGMTWSILNLSPVVLRILGHNELIRFSNSKRWRFRRCKHT